MNEPTVHPLWLSRGAGTDPTRSLRPATDAVTMGAASVLGTATGTGGRTTAGGTSWREATAATDGRFAVRELIGSGGMGSVFAAEQTALGRTVAVKVLPDGCLPDERGAFHAEARLAAGLDHPGVVPVHDAGDDYLVMHLVRGETFADWLRGHQPIREHLAAAVEILIRVADAVAHAHAHAVVHRDIKPANILVGGFGETVLADWGLAVRLGEDGRVAVPQGLEAAGTPAYMAPEMALGDVAAIGPGSDVFLLGTVLYRILAGAAPYRGDRDAVLRAAAKAAWPPLPADAPAELAALVARAMAADPAARGNAAEFATRLRRWLSDAEADRAAAAALAEAQRRLADARQASAPAAIYDACAGAAESAELSLAGRPGAAAAAARTQALDLHARTALAAGDLALAERLTHGLEPGPDRDCLGTAIAAAVRTRGTLRRRQRLVRWTGVAALGLALTALGAALWWGLHQGERERIRRASAAAALVAEARSTAAREQPGSELQRRAALASAHRALGLAPADGAAAQLITELATAIAHEALATDRPGIAEEMRSRVAAVEPARAAAIAAAIAAGETGRSQRRAAAELAWRQRFDHLIGFDQEKRQRGANLDHLTTQLLAWDGPELAAAVDRMLGIGSTDLRAFAAFALGVRAESGPAAKLLPLLDDPSETVRTPAWTALGRRRDPSLNSAILAHWSAMPDRWDARFAACLLGPGADALLANRGIPPEVRRELGDHRGWLSSQEAIADRLGATECLEAAAAADRQCDDLDLARTWAERALQRDPTALAAQVRLAAIDRAAGRPAAARKRLEPLAAGDGMFEVLPELIAACRALGDEAAVAHWSGPACRLDPHRDDLRTEAWDAVRLASGRFTGRLWRDWGAERWGLNELRWRQALDAGDTVVAERILRLTLERWPSTCHAWTALALLRSRAGDHALAERCCRRAWEEAGDQPSLLVAWAEVRRAAGDPAGALAIAGRELEADGDPAPVIAAGRDAGLTRAVHRLIEARIAAPAVDAWRETEGHADRAGDDFAPLAVRVRDLLELRQPGLAVRQLQRAVSPRDRRLAMDAVLLAIPELRRTGWPGHGGGDLSDDCLREAALCLTGSSPDPARSTRWLADAGSGDAFQRDLAAGIAACAAAAPDAATRLDACLAAHPGATLRLGWPLRLGRAWAAHARAGGGAPWPGGFALVERRPLPDLRLHPDDRAILLATWKLWQAELWPIIGHQLSDRAARQAWADGSAARAGFLDAIAIPEAPAAPAWDAWLAAQPDVTRDAVPPPLQAAAIPR